MIIEIVQKKIGGFWRRHKKVSYFSGGVSKKGIALLTRLAANSKKRGVNVYILPNFSKGGRRKKPDYSLYVRYKIVKAK